MVKITLSLGSNYAEHILGVGHVQPHAYHHIPHMYELISFGYTFFGHIYPFMVMFDLISTYLIFPFITTIYITHNWLVSQLSTVLQ